jgi:uncharacterized BrkB/YihY/UPF0761 family membrane protein
MSQPDPQTQPSRPRWTFISVAMFILGLLILVPSGLCTVVFGGMILIQPDGSPGEILSIGLMVLMFGVVPMAVGGLLVWAGLKARSRD